MTIQNDGKKTKTYQPISTTSSRLRKYHDRIIYLRSSNNTSGGGGVGVDSGYTVYYCPMKSSNGNNNSIITPDDWFVGCYLVMVAAADKLIRS